MSEIFQVVGTVFLTILGMLWFMAFTVTLTSSGEWWVNPLLVTSVFAFMGIFGILVYKILGLFVSN